MRHCHCFGKVLEYFLLDNYFGKSPFLGSRYIRGRGKGSFCLETTINVLKLRQLRINRTFGESLFSQLYGGDQDFAVYFQNEDC